MCYKRTRRTAGVSSYDDRRGYFADSTGLALYCLRSSSFFACVCCSVSYFSAVLSSFFHGVIQGTVLHRYFLGREVCICFRCL